MRFELQTSEVRSKFIMDCTRAAIGGSNLDVNAFGMRVAAKYLADVPVLDRVTKFVAIEGDVDSMTRAKIRNGEIAMRYIKGEVKFPCDLEEAWVDSLPEPWRGDLIRDLAQRYGLLGARKADITPQQHWACLADLLADAGRTTQALAPMYADGRLTREDAPFAQRALAEIQRMQADLASMEAQVRAVLPTAPVTTLRSAG